MDEGLDRKMSSDKGTERWNPQVLYYWVLSILIVGSLLVSTITPKSNDIPAELQGTWITSDAAHADRFLHFSVMSIVFGTGNGGVATGFVQGVDVAVENDQTLYAIDYRTDSGNQRVLLVYRPQDGTLRFKNQDKLIWKKRSS